MFKSKSIALTTPLILVALAACGDDDDSNNPGDNNEPPMLTALRTGTLVADGPGGAPDATGGVTISSDSSGNLFVTLGDDFNQEMGPGDTQLILAKLDTNVTEQRDADATNTTDSLATVANGFSGAATFQIPASVNTDEFTFLIVWCPTAGVNFGVAQLSGSPEPEPTRTAVREASLVADGAGGAPDATGTVRIERDATGGLYVALADDFAQEMGPGDTQLILARTGDNIQSQRDADAESTSMSLGTIPNGASGERAFALPSDVDLDDFDYAVIWCPTAGVNFGVAQLPLRAGQLAGDGPGNAPDASGGIAISRGADNALTIELADDFMQEMGPGDTQLILAKGDGNVNDQRTMAASNASDSLGTITNGASGSQSFAVPDDVDLDQFDYAIIWCPTAGVNFGVAELN